MIDPPQANFEFHNSISNMPFQVQSQNQANSAIQNS